jgi:glutamate formiminotransferase
VSAGGEKGHRSILLGLLQQAQQSCQSAGNVGVVHAFADPVYNRSSFHLVGEANEISKVAASLARRAVQRLRSHTDSQVTSSTTEDVVHHPSVGFVDHVSIMSVEGEDAIPRASNDSTAFAPATASGRAARHVGQALADCGVHVHYYGSAHASGTPLATIRKEKTQFFMSGGLSKEEDKEQIAEVATVGSPLTFVENYNIRLKANCPKRTAQSLTKRVRERSGGLTGVEALTLPYSEGRWEVACNLLQPKVASSLDIDSVVQAWEKEQDEDYVEVSYRVGTTAEECLAAIADNDHNWNRYNEKVEQRLKGYLIE